MTLDELLIHIDTSGDATLFEAAGHIRTLQGQLSEASAREREAFQKGFQAALRRVDDDLRTQALHPKDKDVDKNIVVGILQNSRDRLKLIAPPETA